MKQTLSVIAASPKLILIVFYCSACIWLACNELNSKTPNDPSTSKLKTSNSKKMLNILADIASKNNNPQNIYSGEAKLAKCNADLATASQPADQLNLLFLKASILLELGDEIEAVEIYEKISDYLKNAPKSRPLANAALGLAYLRLAERNNCVNNHSAEACIMPIQGNGIHQDKAPGRKAFDTFQKVLQENPDDFDSRWLLNIAAMTIGIYPEGVPKPWLISGLGKSGAVQVKPFTDIASDLKLDVKNRAGGIIVDDFNNDGYLDVICSAWGLDDPLHFFLNNADGTFKDVSSESGLSSFTGGLNLLQADYDNDGFMDFLLLRGAWLGNAFGMQPNSLFHNNGDGTFTDVTIDAGLLSYCPTQTATWNDFNHDGQLDLFIGNETSDESSPFPCELYMNNGNGTFKNVAAQAGVDVKHFVKGVTSGDYDNDGWPDLFLSCISGQQILLHNKGITGAVPQFEDVSQAAGFTKNPSNTFPTFFFDYDNDGWLDIFVCDYDFNKALSYYTAQEAIHPSNNRTGKMYLFHNNQNGTFTDVAPSMHVNQTIFAMGANFGDIDNDGWLDMYMGTGNPDYKSLVPNRLYKNLGGKDFADVTYSSRTGNLQKGHGVSFADINNNGDQDLFIEMGGAYRGDGFNNSLYLNPGQNTNNWICLKLEGTNSNRSAIGAKIKLKINDGGRTRYIYREENSGGSFGCSPLRREIGIGQAKMIDELTIYWPASGIVQAFRNIQPNQFIKIQENSNKIQQLPIKMLQFKHQDGTMPMCAPAR